MSNIDMLKAKYSQGRCLNMIRKSRIVSRMLTLAVGAMLAMGLLWTSPAVVSADTSYIESIPFDCDCPTIRPVN